MSRQRDSQGDGPRRAAAQDFHRVAAHAQHVQRRGALDDVQGGNGVGGQDVALGGAGVGA